MSSKSETAISVSLINYRLQIAERLGGNRERILLKAGIDPSSVSDSSGFVSVDDERALWRAISEDTARDDIGLISGLHFPAHSMGILGYVMMNSPSIVKAIEKFCRYQTLVGNSMGMVVETDVDYYTIRIQLWSSWYEELRFTMDMFVAACLSWIENNTTRRARPLRVGILYRQPKNVSDYWEAFHPAPVEFGCDSSYLVYRREDLETTVLGSNTPLFQEFDTQLERLWTQFAGHGTIARKVVRLILEQMAADAPDISTVASQLAMSVRSLQKALKEENTSFRKLLNEVRRDVAIEHLRERELNLSEIAYLLGYSELAVFSRHFKRWTGTTPTDYRTHHSR